MIFTFITIQHNSLPASTEIARSALLREFEKLTRKMSSTELKSISLSFNTYEFDQYPDQDKLKNFIKKEYTNKRGEMYFGGDHYTDFDKLFADLKIQKSIVELKVCY